MIDVIVGGDVNGGATVRCYSFSGTQKWAYYTSGGYVTGVAVDKKSGRVALALAAGSNNIRVLSKDGDLIWQATHSTDTSKYVRAVCFDLEGNLIVGADYISSSPFPTIRKYDPDGNLLWSATAGGNACYAVAVDSQNNIIAGSNGGSQGIYVRKFSPAGVQIASFTHGAGVLCLAVDSQDNVVMGGVRYDFAVTTRKLNSSLGLLWNADHGGAVYGVAVDPDDNIITGGAIASSLTTRKYNAAGVQQWADTYGAQVRAVACDAAGNAYTTGMLYNSTTTLRYNAAGTHAFFASNGASTYGIATVSEGLPSIPIGVSFGDIIPLREAGSAVTLFGYTVYRCYLSGSGGTIEIPMSSFQARRRSGAETWLSVVSPAVTDDLIAAINARSDGEIIIKRGLRYPDNTEQLDEMMRIGFDSLRTDIGAGSASMTLTGRSAETVTVKTRALVGVSYRPTNAGVRRVRCAVDTYLTPGDTADLGAGETMPAAEIVVWVSPQQAYMEVAEA